MGEESAFIPLIYKICDSQINVIGCDTGVNHYESTSVLPHFLEEAEIQSYGILMLVTFV